MDEFRNSKGPVADLMRVHDWSASPLGNPAGWPRTLQLVVELMLSSKFPMFVAWGPKLGFLYNDAYSEILQEKHPAALGRRFDDVWREIWPDVSPLVDATLKGEAVYRENLPLLMNRKGFEEETWFTFSYSPVRDEQGEIAGLFCAVAETTTAVVAERNLRDSESRLRLAIDGARIGTWDWDLKTSRGTWSPRTMEILGSDVGENITLDQRIATIHPDDRERVWQEYKDALKAHGDLVSEYRAVRPNGEVRWISSRGAFERDAERWAVRTAGIVIDITESKVAETALRESEARFRLMADAVPQIVWITDAQGRAEFFNKQWANYTGIDPAPSSVERAADHIHPDDAGATLAAFQQCTVSGEPFRVEHRIRSRTGEYRWFLVRAEAYRDPVTGKIARWFGASVDIHDRKLAEARLHLLNENLEDQVAERSAERERLWNLSQDMLARADFSGMMSAVSPAWGRVLGWSEAELLARPYRSLIHPDDLPATMAAIDDMDRSGQPARFENRIATKSGEFKPIEWTVTPEPDGKNFIAVGRDLTDSKMREVELERTQEALRQAQKMEAVGQLTGGLAHDFNNLLMGVSGALELMSRRLQQGRADEVGRYIEMAEAGVSRAASLTHRLLAFSRRQTLDPQPTDLGQVIGNILDLLKRSVGPTIRIDASGVEAVWPTLLDQNQFENALLNLSINARDAMPNGGVIRIGAENWSAGVADESDPELNLGDYVRVWVTDSGEGMSQETIARAFDPFFTTKPIGEEPGLACRWCTGSSANPEAKLGSPPSRAKGQESTFISRGQQGYSWPGPRMKPRDPSLFEPKPERS
ncbi:hypothetical protein GCM10011515_15490 [Tsuneonella deserti]|uniref:histidine kinase n=1 Tax=Tsuneonella deserti TaxID=2035528 RepID=A0ABQ1S8W5_9SPHN|nr:PAS domain-containing protein [Tsuneonella deserti]GGD96528.1 hypothetical protein GCM10011515_15490 [Tsuneonella deserti]